MESHRDGIFILFVKATVTAFSFFFLLRYRYRYRYATATLSFLAATMDPHAEWTEADWAAYLTAQGRNIPKRYIPEGNLEDLTGLKAFCKASVDGKCNHADVAGADDSLPDETAPGGAAAATEG